jgi:hypothetical protein
VTATPTKPRRGAPLKDPTAGKRISVTLRLHPDTVRRLKYAAGFLRTSQGEAVDRAVASVLPQG